jgi:hypothetical protein
MGIPVKKIGLNATLVQFAGAPSRLMAVSIVNSSAATAFIQLFNNTTGNVTLGTTTPDLEYEVAAAGSLNAQYVDGILFSGGIAGASTTTDGGLTGSAAGVEVFLSVA